MIALKKFFEGVVMMVDVVLIGLRGYGAQFFREYVQRAEQGKVRIVGAVNRSAPEGETKKDMERLGIPYFSSLDAFYREKSADLVNISSPIQYHCEQTCLSLKHGSHVLCEKPTAATVEEVMKMIDYRDAYRRNVLIGYQWAFSDAIQALKKDILQGKFGKPLRLKTVVLWPRNDDYYARGWAGKIKDASGRWVLDSVAANATAHFLQNMFYVLGESLEKSALPQYVVAETYRANRIENFDTAAIRAYTERGTELLFLASHAVHTRDVYGPVFEYEFEEAVIHFRDEQNRFQKNGKQDEITAVYRDGREVHYGSPFDNPFHKIDVALEAVQKDEPFVPCGLETASAQTLCIHGVHESVPQPVSFAEDVIRYDGADRIVWVDGLVEAFKQCYAEWKMPHELGCDWARRGREVNLSSNALYKRMIE